VLAPFRNRSYRFQWPADLLTSWAFEMENLILAWYVLVETGSVVMLTIFGALYYGGTLIAPMLGVVSDRIGHRTMLAGMRAIYAILAGTLLVLALSGLLVPLAVFCLAVLMGLVRPSDMGLRGALIADFMPLHQLTSAMSISRTTGDTARIAGALAGAGLFAAFGIAPAYMVITAFYALGAVLTLFAAATVSTQTPAAPVEKPVVPSSPWRDLREGLVHVWNTPSLLAIVWLAFLFNLTTFPITQGLLPYVAKDIYHTDQTGLGYLTASIAFGALVGAVALSSFGANVHLSRLMFVSGVVWHLLLLVFSQMEAMPGGIVTLLLVGFAQSITMVSHAVILLRAAGQRFRGRVMGVRMMAIYSLPLGLLAAGVLIGRIGFHATAALYAVVGLASLILIYAYWHASLWRLPVPEDRA
jgi:MFS family permease